MLRHTKVVRNVKLYISVYVTLTSSLDKSGTYIESAVRNYCTQRERFKIFLSFFYSSPIQIDIGLMNDSLGNTYVYKYTEVTKVESTPSQTLKT